MIDAVLLGIALAMDSLTMSIVNGLRYANYSRKYMILSSFSFGLFQGLMPYLGYLIFLPIIGYIEDYDHWLVLVILGGMGIRTIIDSFKEDDESQKGGRFTLTVMLIESIATSIDALSSCIALPAFSISPEASCLIIFATTTIICLIGHGLGKKARIMLKDKAQIFAGIILIVLGVKCVLEHLSII